MDARAAHEALHAVEAGDALAHRLSLALDSLSGPLRVGQVGTGGAHKVAHAGLQQFLGIGRVPDQGGADHRDLHHLTDTGGQFRFPALVKAGGLPGGVHGLVDTGAHVDQVHAGGLKELTVLLGQLQGDALLPGQADIIQVLTGADPDGDGIIGAAGLPNAPDDIQGEAGPFFHTAAVGVGAVIGVGAQELVDQVAVGAVDHHAVHPGLLAAHRTIHVLLDLVGDVLQGHLVDRLMDALTLDGTGGRHLPVAVEHAHALAARVVQLHEEGTLIGPQGLHQLLIAGNLGVVVNAQVPGVGTARHRVHGDGLAHNQAHAAFCPLGVKGDVCLADGAVQLGQGVADGLKDDPVFNLQRPDFTG